ncbi:EamA family transporter [Massilia sp. CCM 8733]|uniref:EamA family transporter n=2 Tax=Massilia mucilaginosa TaxID=2609282 RepID=A0ABX0NSR5_9BURK|nr:DMT family transporter [Massilia mucilaginosa]NHZ89918.1 EamA family transporter [Massilia mucilaginosa]
MAHVAAVLFGLTGIFGVLIHADATVITFGRAAFAVAALALFSLARKRPLLRGLDRYKLCMVILSGLLLAAHWITFFIAVKVGGVALATLGFASFPACIALLDTLVFRERIGAPEAALLALVSLGLILVAPSYDMGDRGSVGLLWGMLSGLSFALLAVTNRRGTRGMDALQVAFWQNLVVTLAVAPFAAAGLGAPARLDWLYLALLGVFCTGLAQYLFVKSLERLNARSAGMIIALEPVYAIACAWWLFAQQPAPRMLAGAALIVVAILLSARARAPSPLAPDTAA